MAVGIARPAKAPVHEAIPAYDHVRDGEDCVGTEAVAKGICPFDIEIAAHGEQQFCVITTQSEH
jgi:hypothetical protein